MNKALQLVVISFGLLLALIVGVQLASDTRSLNQLSLYLGIGLFLFCASLPLKSLPFVFFLGGYLELLKVVAWWQTGRYLDPVLLNLPPLFAVAGLSVGTILLMVTGRLKLDKFILTLWCISLGLGAAFGVKALATYGMNSSGLGEAANSSVYLMMIAVMGSILRNADELQGILKSLVLIYLPCALYGIYQGIFGYPDFHLDFLLNFRSFGMGDFYQQPAGSMNSPISFANSMSICFAAVLFRAILRGQMKTSDYFLFFIFVTAALVSGRRSGLLVIPILLIAYYCYKSPAKTKGLYGLAVTVLLCFYLFASPLMKVLYDANRSVGIWAENAGASNSLVARLSNVGTFSDRLLGFRNMARNPDLWKPFGVKQEKGYGKFGFGRGEGAGSLARQGDFESMRDDFVHDGLNKTIITFGYVPVGILGVIGLMVLVRSHKIAFSIREQKDRRTVVFTLAYLFAVSTLTLSSQQALTIFPGNLLIFTLLGGVLAVSVQGYRRNLLKKESPMGEDAPVRIGV